MAEPIHLISLGAGVQSSTMALMAAAGEITPMPDGAIFADTGDEPASVYRWLDYLTPLLPFPVHRVQHGVLSVDSLTLRVRADGGTKYLGSQVPAYLLMPDGSVGTMHRNCTRDYKVSCIMRKARELAGIRFGQRHVGIEQWIGISADEAHRMKDSRVLYAKNRYPLVDLGMKRSDCLGWMLSHGYPRPPRSACVFCPFHGSIEWYNLKTDQPFEFGKAVSFEQDLQRTIPVAGYIGVPYLTRRCVPLESIDWYNITQQDQLDLFGNECEGMCGV